MSTRHDPRALASKRREPICALVHARNIWRATGTARAINNPALYRWVREQSTYVFVAMSALIDRYEHNGRRTR